MTRARAILLGSAASIFFAALTPALALTPDQRGLLFGSPFVPMWQCILTTGVLCPGITVNSPSLGGLVKYSTGALTYKANNLLTYSNTFSNAAWTKAGVSLSNANAVPDPFGGTAATTVTATAPNGLLYSGWYLTSGAPNGIVSFWLRRNSGSGTVNIYNPNGSGITAVSLTSSWQRFFVVSPPNATPSIIADLQITTSGDAVDVYAPTLSVATYETPAASYTTSNYTTNPRIADQVITTASAYYGPAFDYQQGLRIWEQRVNYFLNSAVGATQNVTTTAVPYTLSCWGTGTITLTGTSTAGPLTCSGAAPTSSVTPTSLTFTPTAGTLTLTVAGSATYVNLEQATFPGPRILTGSVGSVTASADGVTLTGVAASPFSGTNYSAVMETNNLSGNLGATYTYLLSSSSGNTPLFLFTTATPTAIGTFPSFLWAPQAVNFANINRFGFATGPSSRTIGANTALNYASDANGQGALAGTVNVFYASGSGKYASGWLRGLSVYNSKLPLSALQSKLIVGGPY